MTISEVSRVDRVPLSVQQEFLCMWDKGDEMGPFGPRYHIVDGWHVHGELDLATLRGALADVVARHEALRTTIVRADGDRHQLIEPPSQPALAVRELGADPDGRDRRGEQLLNEVMAAPLSAGELPLLRAVLGRFDEHESVLVLAVHHTAADAWSMQVLIRDVLACYAARCRGTEPELPAVAQYREYAADQLAAASTEATAAARAYWRDRLRDARTVALPTDRLRSAHPVFETSWYRFSWGPELRELTTAAAREMRCSPFMVLLAAFTLYVHGLDGERDVTVPTFTPGRDQARFQDSVGSFFNCLPLRTDLTGCATFRDVVARTRSTCLAAYRHEIPFAYILGEAPELMADVAVDGFAPCTLQVIQTPSITDRVRVGELEYRAIRHRMLSQPVGSDIPDGTLLCLELDATGHLIGELGYSSNLYDHGTAREIVASFREVLRAAVSAPDATVLADQRG